MHRAPSRPSSAVPDGRSAGVGRRRRLVGRLETRRPRASAARDGRRPSRSSGRSPRMMAMRLISSEMPCTNSSAKASGIRNLDRPLRQAAGIRSTARSAADERQEERPRRVERSRPPSAAGRTRGRRRRSQLRSRLREAARSRCRCGCARSSASVHGAHSRNTAPNSHHCISSQEFELMSNTLRTIALPALTSDGDHDQPGDRSGRCRPLTRRRSQRLTREQRLHSRSPPHRRSALPPRRAGSAPGAGSAIRV